MARRKRTEQAVTAQVTQQVGEQPNVLEAVGQVSLNINRAVRRSIKAAMGKPQLVKLVVFVPTEAEETVRLALCEAGAGRIGNYDYCAFVARGTGHFRPLEGAQPTRGSVGRIESADECRLEVLVAEKDLPQVLAALRAAHPYEEVAYDILPLLNDRYAQFVPTKPREQ